jgi:hypothetical protein
MVGASTSPVRALSSFAASGFSMLFSSKSRPFRERNSFAAAQSVHDGAVKTTIFASIHEPPGWKVL